MNENTAIAIVCVVVVAGCSTCHVAEEWREVEIERIKAEERQQLLNLEKP